MDFEDDVLEVKNYLRDIFLDAGDCCELMLYAVNLYRCDCVAGKG